MIYLYYRVSSPSEFRARIDSYFEEGRAYGLEKIMQKVDEPGLFMEVVRPNSNIDESLTALSGLRAKHGIVKFISDNEIHVEAFDVVLGPSK